MLFLLFLPYVVSIQTNCPPNDATAGNFLQENGCPKICIEVSDGPYPVAVRVRWEDDYSSWRSGTFVGQETGLQRATFRCFDEVIAAWQDIQGYQKPTSEWFFPSNCTKDNGYATLLDTLFVNVAEPEYCTFEERPAVECPEIQIFNNTIDVQTTPLPKEVSQFRTISQMFPLHLNFKSNPKFKSGGHNEFSKYYSSDHFGVYFTQEHSEFGALYRCKDEIQADFDNFPANKSLFDFNGFNHCTKDHEAYQNFDASVLGIGVSEAAICETTTLGDRPNITCPFIVFDHDDDFSDVSERVYISSPEFSYNRVVNSYCEMNHTILTGSPHSEFKVLFEHCWTRSAETNSGFTYQSSLDSLEKDYSEIHGEGSCPEFNLDPFRSGFQYGVDRCTDGPFSEMLINEYIDMLISNEIDCKHANEENDKLMDNFPTKRSDNAEYVQLPGTDEWIVYEYNNKAHDDPLTKRTTIKNWYDDPKAQAYWKANCKGQPTAKWEFEISCAETDMSRPVGQRCIKFVTSEEHWILDYKYCVHDICEDLYKKMNEMLYLFAAYGIACRFDPLLIKATDVELFIRSVEEWGGMPGVLPLDFPSSIYDMWSNVTVHKSKACSVELWYNVSTTRIAAQERCRDDPGCLGLMWRRDNPNFGGVDGRRVPKGSYKGCGGEVASVKDSNWDTIEKPVCMCSFPGAPAPDNGFKCLDETRSGYCGVGELCYTPKGGEAKCRASSSPTPVPTNAPTENWKLTLLGLGGCWNAANQQPTPSQPAQGLVGITSPESCLIACVHLYGVYVGGFDTRPGCFCYMKDVVKSQHCDSNGNLPNCDAELSAASCYSAEIAPTLAPTADPTPSPTADPTPAPTATLTSAPTDAPESDQLTSSKQGDLEASLFGDEMYVIIIIVALLLAATVAFLVIRCKKAQKIKTVHPGKREVTLPVETGTGSNVERMKESPKGFKYHAFLTHNWGPDELERDNHERVAVINAALQEQGVATWFDSEKMEGNIVDHMCAGIDESCVVVVFVTRNYIAKVRGENENDNCKIEFNYARARKTGAKMLAVPMDPSCRNPIQWEGAVGAVLGSRLYPAQFSFDLDDTQAFEDNVKALVQVIKDQCSV